MTDKGKRSLELVIYLDGMALLTRRTMEVQWDASPTSFHWNIPLGIEGNAHFVNIQLHIRNA